MTRCGWLEITGFASLPAIALSAMVAACVGDSAEPVICASGLACAPGWRCHGEGQSCYPGTCGNRKVDRDNGEVCDDDDIDGGDGCERCVILEQCGDGKLDPGEACDYRAKESSTGCSSDCRSTLTCGNGIVDPGEDCDAGEGGTPRATATCDIDCTRPFCGDGVLNPLFVNPATGQPEVCDLGISTAECDADCTPVICGDGVHNAAVEECDDGNGSGVDAGSGGDGGSDGDAGSGVDAGINGVSDGCPASCKLPRCGDGHVWRGVEHCDSGGVNTKGCDADCTAVVCHDGVHNAAAGEECDDGNTWDDDDCVKECERAQCGDGHHWLGVEYCDSSEVDTGTCDSDCTVPACGDGHRNRAAGEGCDDGNVINHDGCPTGPGGTCQPATCGDGFVWPDSEVCDPGNADSATCNGSGAGMVSCQPATCGDGYRNAAAGEECDEGQPCPDGGTCLLPGSSNECRCSR